MDGGGFRGRDQHNRGLENDPRYGVESNEYEYGIRTADYSQMQRMRDREQLDYARRDIESNPRQGGARRGRKVRNESFFRLFLMKLNFFCCVFFGVLGWIFGVIGLVLRSLGAPNGVLQLI